MVVASLVYAGSKELSLQLPARLSPVKGVDAVALMAAVGEAASTAAQTSSEGGACMTAGATASKGIERVACKGGAAAEVISSSFDLIVLDCSCTASRLHQEVGVTDVAPAYAQRRPSSAHESIAKPQCFNEPGTAVKGVRTRFGTRTAYLYSRWSTSAPSKSASSQPLPGTFRVNRDTQRARDEWYKGALHQLDELVGDAGSVAFASNGTTSQREGVCAFAARHPHLRVAIIQRTDGMVEEMRQKAAHAHGGVLRRMALSARREASQLGDPQLMATAMAICDDIDNTLLSAPTGGNVGEAYVASGGMADGEAPPPSVGAQRAAITQVALHHISAGDIESARTLLSSAPAPLHGPANTTGDGVPLDGLEDWGGLKSDVRTVRLDADTMRQLSNGCCHWEWDIPTAAHVEGVVNSGDYRWVEEIVITEDNHVSRTGVLQGNPADISSVRYIPPEHARRALRRVRSSQYDELQLARMAIERIEAGIAQRAEEQERQSKALDDRYREYLQKQVDQGRVTPRTVCDELVGSSLASAFIADATQSLCAAAGMGESYLTSAVPDDGAASKEGPTAGASVQTAFELNVSSTNSGRNTPLKLRGVKFAGGGDEDVDAAVHDNIQDTGSCTYLAGLQWAQEAERRAPQAVERVKKRPTSLDGVSGVGGAAQALYYLRIHLLYGNCKLTLEDVPVVANIPGLLLGTDVLGRGGATIRFWQQSALAADGLPADGVMTMRDPVSQQDSTPLPFVHRVSTMRECFLATSADESQVRCSRAGVLSGLVLSACENAGALDAAAVTRQAEEAVAKELIACATPIAYAPQSLRVPKWSQRKLRVRVPAALIGDHEVCVVPLDDDRLDALGGLHIYSTTQKPDADGYVDVVAQNSGSRDVEVGMLTAVGKFMADPTREECELEFTTDEIMKLIHIDEDASEKDLRLIRQMVESCRRLFSTVLGYAHGYKMSIKTKLIDEGKANPPNIPNRARSRDETAALKEAVDKQLKAGLLMPCRSPYNAQPVMVRKADWTPEKPTYRMTLDFRPLNALTERDAYPLPSVDHNLAALGKAKLFSTADLLMGFHQCELEEHDGSRLKTAFGTPWGQFCYKRMPMGLTSSPGCFMRLVDSALRGLPPGLALAYADDIICATAGDMEQHMRDVTQVFGRLIEAGFTVRCDKVHVGMKSVPYLGFIVGGDGTRPNAEKTRALLDMAMEQLIREPSAVGRFAGMIGVYARYIPNCHLLLAPFHDMKQKGADTSKVETMRMRTGFAALKRLLANATALARPDFEKTFYVDVDSATVGGVGMVLTQREDELDPDTHKPLAFGSHKFNDNERAFTIRDQECFGLYKSLQQWRHLLLGSRVVVRTDHKSLQWLMRNNHPDGSRVSGWALKLQEFDVEIKWVEGKHHIAADCLSRAFEWRDLECMGQAPQERGKAEGATGEDPATEKRLDDLEAGTFLTMAEARTTHRAGGQAIFVLINMMEGGQTKVLVERHDDSYALPGAVLEHQSRTTYRGQLIRQLQQTYGRDSTVVRLARKATRHQLRHKPGAGHSLGMVFLSAVGDGDAYPAGTGLVDLATAVAAVADDIEHGALCLVQCVLSHKSAEDMRAVHASMAQFKGVGSAVLRLRQTAAAAYIAGAGDSLWEASCSVPRVSDVPTGPALCETDEDARTAITHIQERLRLHPALTMSVDLEGELGTRQSHISLIQVCVDGMDESEPQLVYVFDTHCNRRILAARGEHTLSSLLEDERVVKVLHCCGGDAAALQEEYGIALNNAFDTGIADMLLARRPNAVLRNLETVIRYWVGDSTDVKLTFKGKMQFIPGMFNKRPLSLKLFVYSYEDVTYCNQLHTRMQLELQQQDLIELTHVLSQQRVPSSRVDVNKPSAYPGDLRIAVALVDTTSVACLHEGATGLHSLPNISVSDISPVAQTVKQYAQYAWAACMGTPPKGVAAAVNARPRRPVQLGDTLLFVATVDSCLAALAPLSAALAGSTTARTHTVIIRSRDKEGTHSKGVHPAQRALFQYLFVDADRARRRRLPVADAFHIRAGPQQDARPALRVHLHLSCRGGAINAELCMAIHPATQRSECAEVNIVTGPTTTNQRGAVIVHDGELVLALNGTDYSAELSFPSHQIEPGGNARDAAARGFDLMCGSALRRGGEGGSQTVYESHSLSPQLSVMLTRGFDEMPSIGTWGNTEYFCCVLQPGTLRNFASAFYMARQPVNGYRLTPTLQKRHVGFQLARTLTALKRLQRCDVTALEAALSAPRNETSHSTGVQLVTAVLHAQACSDTCTGSIHGPGDTGVSQHSDGVSAQQASMSHTSMPSMGVDEDFDALFEAHVLLNYCALSTADAGVSQHSDEVPQRASRPTPITRAEILDAQLAHPGTRQFIDYLKHGPLDERLANGSTEELSELMREVARHELAHDGLLLRRLDAGLRIVVPPSLQERVVEQCHDGVGHFGIKRSLQILKDRFYWDGTRQMRNVLADHIRCCDACQRSNILHHKPGVASIAEHGECPCDSWAMDVYKTGSESGGYDSVLDFMCLFSHLVVAEPVNSHLDSVGVCNILIKSIISPYGCPSSIRCDNASIFISEITQALYKIFKIRVKTSAAYHHRSIGALERFHSVLKKLMAAQRIASGVDQWHVHLPLLVLAYNATVGSTGYSPFYVVFGRQPNLPIDAFSGTPRKLPVELPEYIEAMLAQMGVVWDATAQALLRNSLHALKKMDLSHDVNEEFRAGDLVLLKKGSVVDNPKLHPKAVEVNDGPYVVLEVHKGGNAKLGNLRSQRIKDVVNVERLTRYFTRATMAEEEEALPRLERRWAVLRIAGHRYTTTADALVGRENGEREIEYKVQWAGLGKEYSKYLARPYLNSIWELVAAYNDNNKIDPEFAQPAPLPHETREPPERPPVSKEARRKPHFRPADTRRRREARDTPEPQQATATAADIPRARSAAVVPPSAATPAAPIPADATHADRAEQRAQKRAAWLEAERVKREDRAARLRSAAESTALVAQPRVYKRPNSARWTRAPQVLATQSQLIRLVGTTGRVFEVPLQAALFSGTVRSMIESKNRVEGAVADEFKFTEIEDELLAEAIRYMEYKLKRQRDGYQGPFDITDGMEVRLFRVANYLDL